MTQSLEDSNQSNTLDSSELKKRLNPLESKVLLEISQNNNTDNYENMRSLMKENELTTPLSVIPRNEIQKAIESSDKNISNLINIENFTEKQLTNFCIQLSIIVGNSNFYIKNKKLYLHETCIIKFKNKIDSPDNFLINLEKDLSSIKDYTKNFNSIAYSEYIKKYEEDPETLLSILTQTKNPTQISNIIGSDIDSENLKNFLIYQKVTILSEENFLGCIKGNEVNFQKLEVIRDIFSNEILSNQILCDTFTSMFADKYLSSPAEKDEIFVKGLIEQLLSIEKINVGNVTKLINSLTNEEDQILYLTK